MNLTVHRKPLGQLLLGRGHLAPAQLELALAEQRRQPVRRLLGEILVEFKACSEEQVAEALADSYGVPFTRLGAQLADPKVLRTLPRDFMEREMVLPLFLVEGLLTIAVVEPANVFLLDEVRRLTGHKVQVVATTASDVREMLRAHLPDATPSLLDQQPAAAGRDTWATGPTQLAPRTRLAASPAPEASPSVHRAACACLDAAIKESATDVHFEPDEAGARVRFRVDGGLEVRTRHDPAAHAAIVAHLKAMAGIGPGPDAAAHGVIRVRAGCRDLELFLSAAPVVHGEKVVVRIRDAARSPHRLEKLGFGYETLKQWRRLVTSPRGLLLVTGPAGSGKRTTLYASLSELDRDRLNVCALDDGRHPPLVGVNHFRAGEHDALTPAAAIRAAVEQEPDVIMVPEIHDAETARATAAAAMSGRLVLAGVHTADSVGAIVRLLTLGADPYVLGSSLAGILCQRLLRRLCPQCREAYDPTSTERKQLEQYTGPLSTLYRPKGCAACRNTGYAGRIAFFELLLPSDLLGDAVCRGAGRAELASLVQQSGTKPLRLDGAEKVKAGIATLSDYLSACTPC
jgi:type II secretory ATPase GspE/PulE/Tfp pilus assembly ATPase PilB-like protein